MKTLYYNSKQAHSFPKERWKDLPDYEDFIQVSNLGRVRSLDRVIPHQRLYTQFVKGKVLSQHIHINSYVVDSKCKPMVDLSVALSREGKTKWVNVRRLVYLTGFWLT